jgi:hypothetical protein
VRASDGLSFGAWSAGFSVTGLSSPSGSIAGGNSVTSSLESDVTTVDATFTSSGGVKSVAFKLDYDPELVAVEDAELGAGVPDTARITLRTVTTEDGAQATITVTSDEPIPAGTVSLASLSVSPRQSGAHLGGLRRLHVHEINSELSGEPQSIRIPIGDFATGLSDAGDTDWNIEFMAAWRDGDGWAPAIRLKAPAAHPGADPAPETIDRDENTADIGTPVKIVMPIPAIDGAHAHGLQRTHRWTFDHTCHDTAGRLPQVRIPHL